MLRIQTAIIACVFPFIVAGAVVLNVDARDERPRANASTVHESSGERLRFTIPQYWWVPDGAQILNRLLTRGNSYRSMGWP